MEKRSARRLTLTVPPEQDGVKVDTLLRRTLGLSGTLVKKAKRLTDGILLDGRPVWVTASARAGQTLSVLVGDLPDAVGDIAPAPGPLDIVYEDEDILILNKSAGVAMHPSPGHDTDTLGNFVVNYYNQCGHSPIFRPVNRLDKGTSGLLCAAQHAHAHEKLKEALHTPAFQRVYLAVCEGVLPARSGVIDAPIGREEGSSIRRTVCPDGLPAQTGYEVLSSAHGRSLVRLTLTTGRTHQIRVHMAHIGCPLTGDFLYGTEIEAISRPALHSHQLTLCHPVTGQQMSWMAPLPDDMARLLEV